MNDLKPDVTIVGGGVIGLCCAYFIRKSGLTVKILDKTISGDESGASFGNAGMIVPSHFTPLAAPGVLKQGLKWMFDSESPLYIKPRMSRSLLAWLLRFVQASNETQVRESAPLIRNLNLLSKQLYGEIHAVERLDFGLQYRGIALLSMSEVGLEEEMEVGERARQLGIEVEFLDEQGIRKLEPDVPYTVKGGVYYPMDAHLIPAQFMKALSSLLEGQGVSIEKNIEVLGFESRSAGVNAIVTNKGKLEVNQIVVASGAWSGMVSRMLGLNIPMQAGKGYSFTLARSLMQLRTPAILTEAKVAVTPMGDRLRFGGTMEIAGMDTTINMKRVRAILKSLHHYYPNFKTEWVNKELTWSGLRPLSPDGLPYIGRSAKHTNVLIATGHAMMGLSLAPITGKLISEIVNEQKTTVDLMLMNPNRYE